MVTVCQVCGCVTCSRFDRFAAAARTSPSIRLSLTLLEVEPGSTSAGAERSIIRGYGDFIT